MAEVMVETAGFLSLLPLCWAVIQEGPWAADAAPCPSPEGLGTQCLRGRSLFPRVCSPLPCTSCLVPFLLAELLFEPIWFPPIGEFPGCG